MNIFKNIAIALFALLTVSACVSTQPISAAKSIGYQRIGNINDSELYVCAKACGERHVIVVHKTDSLSAAERAELTNFAENNTGQENIAKLLNSALGAKGKDDIKFSRAKSTTIGDKSAILIPFKGDGKKPDGGLIIIPDGSKVQLFAGVAENQSDGIGGAQSFARLWAQK